MTQQAQDTPLSKIFHCSSDHCFTDPDKYLTVYCGVCGKSMTANRHVVGPTGFAEAMAVQIGQTKGHLHDTFHCVDRDEAWHEQAKAIRDEASETNSQRLTQLLTEEADEIVRSQKTTKNF